MILSGAGKFLNALAHAFKVSFEGADVNPAISAQGKQIAYHNYFIGNDPSKWASNVRLYKQVTYKELYPAIDLVAYSENENFKYDFVLTQKADPNSIQLDYEGTESLSVKNGALIIKTSVGNIIEQKPFAYQLINDEKVVVECSYVLSHSTIKFSFPNGYNKNYSLIIDPVLVASTYSGSTGTVYGACATYDNAGNIYTAGYECSFGYPATLGAFQASSKGSNIVISKLNSNGTALIYATYLGGTDFDSPASIILNSNNELYVYGQTTSIDFPTSIGCYDNSYAGGTFFNYDLFIAKFTNDGTGLIGCTYIGGADDETAKEIVLDANDNPVVTGNTSSVDFPTTPGCYDPTYNGGGDAFTLKMNTNLSSLAWSTFLGGSEKDEGVSLRVDSKGNIYTAGYTSSTDFPTNSSALNTTLLGTADGFVAHLKNNGSILDYSTFFGTNLSDFIYFIDLDKHDNVYICGTSFGIVPTTAGVYSNPGSGNFITKLKPSLDAVTYSTLVGPGSLNNILTPTAFTVDDCENICLAGYGQLAGYPTSPDAFLNSGSNVLFYLLCLKINASALLYSSYYGSSTSFNHAHGVNRISKSGVLYEAMCQNDQNYSTTAGAYSPTNKTGTYDIMVYKFDFQLPGGSVGAFASVDTVGGNCVPITLNFTNNSSGATGYTWNFGDGSPVDNNASPSHNYTSGGTYTIMLVANNPAGCNVSDTTYLNIELCGGINIDSLFIPNVFSPNGDAKNDLFEVYYEGKKDYSIKIYNRWGQLVFESNDRKKHWNGKDHSSKDYPDGTYYYLITIGELEHTGHLTLLK